MDFKIGKKEQEPVLVHVITKKGKGYKPAEENPDRFHATGSFEIETGKPNKREEKGLFSSILEKN